MSTNKKIIFYILILFLFLISFKSYSQSFNISYNLNIDWQVLDSYTPPFYEGKALPGEQSYLKAVATVEVKTPVGILDPSKFYYLWRYNDSISNLYSKTGNNIIYFYLNPLFPTNVLELEVYENNRQENLLARKIVEITPVPGSVILYRDYNNPLLSYANALNKKNEHYSVNPRESFILFAEPFYFSVKNPNDSKLSYLWSLNGIPGNVNTTNTISYEAPQTFRGDFGLGLKVSNSSEYMQEFEFLSNFILNN